VLELRALEPAAVGRGRRPVGVPPLVAVPAAVVGAAVLLPVAYLVVRAAGAGPEVWELLWSPRTGRILLRSLLLAGAVTASTVLLAVPLAWLTTRTDLPGARLWRVVTALPLVVPSYVGGFVVATALGPAGLLQQLLYRLAGVERLPDVYGFPGAWLVLTLFTYPYVLLSVRAGWRGLDPALEEVARTLGERGWRAFRRAVLPQLWPWIRAGALLVALYTLADFGAVSMMQFETFTTAIYVQYQASFDRHGAAALALVLVALTGALLAAADRPGRGPQHRVGLGPGRRPPRVPLGPWRWPALLGCTGVTLVAVVLPLGVLLYWLLLGLAHGEPLVLTWRPALTSLALGAASAVVTVAAAFPLALLAARFSGPLALLAGRIVYAGYALPGIVVALALVFVTARVVPALYQTPAALLVAYAVLFLPQAAGALRAALARVHPSQEEAARTLGRTPAQVLWSVTLPLVRPGVAAAAALVFLTTMKELPATLLLSPIGMETLATRVWSAAGEGFFARAAAPALLLVLLSSLSLATLARQEEP